MDAIHATGRYPEWWTGYRFTHAPLIWCLGYSGDKCRDLLQQAIFGAYSSGSFSGGLITGDLIEDAIGGAIPRLAQQVNVKWKGPNGEEGTTVLQFKSYSQGQHALMGDGVDWYHIDEEPKDATIWPQVLTRTASGDNGKGGRGILTFTPENGKTELVTKFMDEPSKGQYLQTATWDDAPHLSDEIKEEILSAYPVYQREMRTKGVPLMGAGLIYEVSEDDIKCDPFEVPDYWFVINGMDFGWDHPQAHIQLVWDRDADCFYLINAFKKSKIQPFEAWHVVKPWATNVPTAWPHDGLQTEKGSAKQQKDYYKEEGFNMLPDHATWEDGGNGVWAGIMELNNLMKTGRFKIVSTLTDVFEEIRQYHTKTTADGKSVIVKVKEDLLDAIRYAYMMRRYAIRVCDLYPEQYMQQTNRDTGRDKGTGY
jgi:phage terminase large subunit-like protein